MARIPQNIQSIYMGIDLADQESETAMMGITVEVNGRRVIKSVHTVDDDMRSRWDICCDVIMKQLKSTIEEEAGS